MSSISITKHYYHNVLIKNILVVFLVIFSIFFSIQWYFIDRKIEEYQKITQTEFRSLKKVKTNLIDISTLKSDSLNVTLAKEDVEKINSNIDALASEIYNEKNRA